MEENMPVIMPALALRGLTVFPNMLLHFDVGRESSIKALDEAMTSGQTIFLVAQRELAVENPQEGDLYAVGTISNVRQILRLPGDNVRVMVEGVSRGRLCQLVETNPYLSAEVEEIPGEAPVKRSARTEALIRQTYELFETYIELAPKMTPDILLSVLSSEDPGYIADYIAQNLPMRTGDKQAILEELRPVRRLEKLCQNLRREVEILELEQEMQGKVRDQLTRSQRDYVLREQLKVLQHELGEDQQGGDQELYDYRRQIEKAKLPVEVKEKLEKELRRLEKQPFGSAEATVLRNYLDTVLELPWGKKTKERVNVAAARKTLDADHFGLEKVKTRILEFLAVKQLAPQLKGQILCLVGPPGVGKTSIASSVAKAIHRNMARISLGGVHDEAEIRGHRKTYIGAMPGRIIQTIKRCGSSNPVIILDEVDKVTVSNHGDPSSALLEVLDPEQNTTFHDNYLDMEYDLSKVLFIATANNVGNIAPALRDRMEMINIAGYLMEEKVRIALDHLLPKQRAAHGIGEEQLTLTPEVVECIVAGYTREAGVRSLDKHLAKIARARAKQIAFGERFEPALAAADVEKILGMPKFLREEYEVADMVGVVTGLAWTEVGGDILYVESVLTPGKGKLSLTGNLGDVMKESATIAHEWVMAHHKELGIDPAMFAENDIDIHVPEGAIPKDGPSAGITMVTSIVSTYTGRKVKERIAMTGETTLRGRVMPVGGVKEKILAAKRAGITELILSEDNRKDIAEIKPEYIAGLTFHYVRNNSDVLRLALQ